MFSPKLVILTGASAAGKTTIARKIAAEAFSRVTCLYFDSVGVPSQEQMIVEFGSEENWQRAKTFEWMRRIQQEFLSQGQSVLFEGQMHICFILDACKAAGITNFEVVLIDCDDPSRESRLLINRRQPELANERMMNWARFLSNEAVTNRVRILDTSKVSIEVCVHHILSILDF